MQSNQKMKTAIVAAMCGAALGSAHAQEVFSNGVDVAGTYVFGNGMITLQSTTNTQGDASTRQLAPSVGQLFGVDPDTGNAIALNGDLLQLKPRQLLLTDAANRAYVIAANQLTAGSAITISYQGSNIVLSVASGGVGSSQLEDGAVTAGKLASGVVAPSHLKQPDMDDRYINASGDEMSGALLLQPAGDIGMGCYTNHP